MNKLARYNINIGNRHQNPDIANGKNTLYSFTEMPCANRLRKCLDCLGDDLNLPIKGLLAEANLYYNDTCGISVQPDTSIFDLSIDMLHLGHSTVLY